MPNHIHDVIDIVGARFIAPKAATAPSAAAAPDAATLPNAAAVPDAATLPNAEAAPDAVITPGQGAINRAPTDNPYNQVLMGNSNNRVLPRCALEVLVNARAPQLFREPIMRYRDAVERSRQRSNK